MEHIQLVVYLCTIFSFVCAAFAYVVIRPIDKALKDLGDAISDLRIDIKANVERINRVEGKQSEMEHAIQKAHDRIDSYLGKELGMKNTRPP